MKLALIGIPDDENSSFMRGAAEAPPLIRKEFYSTASNRWSENGIDLDGHPILDAGDIAPGPVNSIFDQIEGKIVALLEEGWNPISLGGDHAITWPILRGMAGKYPELSILHFDAHPDLYDEFEGSRSSHACPFARIMEEGLACRLVQVGIRTVSGHQRDQIERFGVESIEMKDWRDDLKIDFETPVYISFDLDGLDPAFAPGVSHREPGGLSTRQALDIIHRINAPIAGADVVEFNPRRDPTGMTATVCAKLLKEIAGAMIKNSRVY